MAKAHYFADIIQKISLSPGITLWYFFIIHNIASKLPNYIL